jgi:25S rRNA (uracil2634-N3)-methyltransferase
MSKNKKQKARREAKDNHRKKAQQTIPVAANKPLAAPRPTKSPVSKLYSSSKTNPNAKPKSHPKTAPPAQLKAAPALLPKKEPAQEKVKVQAGQKHEVPFGVYDRILLVGEGDFSFAHSLCMEHGCANVTATSFDSAEDVGTKCVVPPPGLLCFFTPPHNT